MANSDATRWHQRLEHLERAFSQLDQACAQSSYTELELAGLVKLFELSFELAWKTLKDLLFYEGYDVNSPREILRQAFAVGIVEDIDRWLEALGNRNRLTHTYDEETARAAEALIKSSYAPMIRRLLETLRKRALGL